jgi:hypothetical protein
MALGYASSFNSGFDEGFGAVNVKARSVGTRASQNTGLISVDYSGLYAHLSGSVFDQNWGEGDKITIDGEVNYIASRQIRYKMAFKNGSFQIGEQLIMPDGTRAEYVKDDSLGQTMSWTRSGTTISVSEGAHGKSVGSIIYIRTSSNTTALPPGYYTVQTVVSASSYTITSPASGTINTSQFATLDDGYRWTRSGGTITIHHIGHIYKTGDYFCVRGSSDSGALPSGNYTVTYIDANSYSITGVNTGATYGELMGAKDSVGNGHITIQFPQNYFNPSLYQSHHRITGVDSGARCVLMGLESNSNVLALQYQSAAKSGLTGLSYTLERCYSTPAAWAAAEKGNLVTANSIAKCVLYADSTYTDSTTVGLEAADWTVDSNCYPWIAVGWGQRHDGTHWGTAPQTASGLPVTWNMNNTATVAITMNVHGWVDDILFKNWKFTSPTANGVLRGSFPSSNTIFPGPRGCIFYQDSSNYSGFSGNHAMYQPGSTAVLIKSSIFIGIEGTACGTNTGSPQAIGCTLYKCNAGNFGGVYGFAGSTVGCIVVGSGGAGNVSISSSSTTGTLVDDANLTHFSCVINQKNYMTMLFVSTTAGAEDLHLQDGSRAVYGTAIGMATTNDAVGLPRGTVGNYDIGALIAQKKVRRVRTSTYTGSATFSSTQVDDISVGSFLRYGFKTGATLTNSKVSLSWTRVTTTATVTLVGHGLTTSNVITVTNSSSTAAITNSSKTLTGAAGNTFTFTCLNAGASSGTLDASVTRTIDYVNTASQLFLVAATNAQPNLNGDIFTMGQGDYSTMTAWNSGEKGDLVSQARCVVAELYKDSVFSNFSITDTQFTGVWRKSNQYFPWITVAASDRHNGVPGSGVMVDPSFAASGGISLNEAFTLVEYLEIKRWTTGTGLLVNTSFGSQGGTYRSQHVIRYCLIHDSSYLPKTPLSWTRVGTVATVTSNDHHLMVSDIVTVTNSSDTAAITNANKTITGVATNTFTFNCLNAGATSGTLTIILNNSCYSASTGNAGGGNIVHDNILYNAFNGFNTSTANALTRDWYVNNTVYNCWTLGHVQGTTSTPGTSALSAIMNNLIVGCPVDFSVGTAGTGTHSVGGFNGYQTIDTLPCFLAFHSMANYHWNSRVIGKSTNTYTMSATNPYGPYFDPLWQTGDQVAIAQNNNGNGLFTITSTPVTTTQVIVNESNVMSSPNGFVHYSEYTDYSTDAANNFISTSAGSENLLLKAGSAVKNRGVGPALLFAVQFFDITGTRRFGPTTDLGADQQLFSGSGELVNQLPVISGTGTAGSATKPGSGDLVNQLPELSGAGTVSHVASGDLVDSLPIVSGSGIDLKTGSGELTNQSAELSGSASCTHICSGEITNQSSQVSGTGLCVHTCSGELINQQCQVSGSGVNTKAGSGELINQLPIISGIAATSHIGSGSLVNQLPIIDGSAVQGDYGTGSINNQLPEVSGTGTVSHVCSGELINNKPVISGTGLFPTTSSGTLTNALPLVSGSGSVVHTSSGNLENQLPFISGSAIYFRTSTGECISFKNEMSGSGNVIHPSSGEITSQLGILYGEGAYGHSGTGELQGYLPQTSGEAAWWWVGRGSILNSAPFIVGLGLSFSVHVGEGKPIRIRCLYNSDTRIKGTMPTQGTIKALYNSDVRLKCYLNLAEADYRG